MTTRVVSDTPTQTVENTLQLGEVTFQGRTYIAILHYHGEGGEQLEVTEAMKAAQTAYCQAIQAILAQAGRETSEEMPNTLLNRVSTGGFIFAPEGEDRAPIPTHRQLETEEAWNRFLYSLHYPGLAAASRSHIELEDITDLSDRREALCRSIEQKLEPADENSSIDFDEDEKRLLRFSHFPKLSRGCYDNAEIALFYSTMLDASLASSSE